VTDRATLERLAVLVGRSWVVAELGGGLTNRNLHVTCEDGREPAELVVRCWYGDAGLLGIDRDAEAHNTEAAAEAGVGPPVLEYRPDLGLLAIGWIPARTLGDADFTDAATLGRAADAVRRLHAGPRFRGDFDMFARRTTYLATIQERGYPLPDRYLDHDADWERVRQALAASPAATVPCNNDLLAANFLDDGDRVWLIDYEYSGNNDPCFELGNTATECGFTDEMTEAYVAAYFGRHDPGMLARTRLQAIVSAYGWSLWGFIQAAASPLDFDFWSWGVERFEKARARFADPGFDRLLDEAAGDE
jgi:thiamine kinase-like enzyme